MDTTSHKLTISSMEKENLADQLLHSDLLAFLIGDTAGAEAVKNIILFPMREEWNPNTLQKQEFSETTYRLLLAYRSFAQTNYLYTKASFTFDIPSMAHRQFSFTKRMHEYGWLYAPFTNSMINRARSRYKNFFLLISESLAPGIVPTSDIDLVWHTHQLSPVKYREFCHLITGKLINHEDKKPIEGLQVIFGESKSAWERRFGIPYAICLCWVCIAAREEADSVANPTPIIEAMARERARRCQLGLPVEIKWGTSGCKDCGNHSDRECFSFQYDGFGYKNSATQTLNDGCDCEICDSNCNCGGSTAGCSNPHCDCTGNLTCMAANVV
jgi:hypothetical protein